jgi:hypothetical protein
MFKLININKEMVQIFKNVHWYGYRGLGYYILLTLLYLWKLIYKIT